MSSTIKYYDELNKLIENEDNFEFFRNLALDNIRDKPEIIKVVFSEVLDFANENNLNKTKAWSHYYLGWYYVDMAEYDNAINAFLSSNDIFETVDDKKGLIYAFNGLTNVYCQIGQFKLANEWGLKGISLAEEINEKDSLVILLINTGINYIQMKYFNKAKEIYNNIEMMDYDLTKQQQISCKLGLAEIEINIGDSNKALICVEEALKLQDERELNTDTCEIFKLKGMAYVKLNEYDIAEKEFMKSYDFSNSQGFTYEKCCTMLEWSKLCIIIGRYENAIDGLKDVVEVCKSKELNIILKECYHLLYSIYKKQDKPKEALMFIEEYNLINDQIYDYEQNQLMAQMNIKHTKRDADLYKLLYDRTELLSTIGQKIISNLNINSIVNIINKEINKLIKTDSFGIAVYDGNKREAKYKFFNEDSDLKNVLSFKIDDESIFSTYCIKNKTDIIIGNITKEYSKYTNLPPFSKTGKFEKSMIYTPLIINGKILGVITVQSFSENAYDKNDLNILKIIANYSAIAIDNAISYKKIEKIATYDGLTGFLTKFEIIRLGEIIYEKYKDNSTINLSVIMIDIDNFKLINDAHGHIAGDKVLNMVTNSISKCIRTTDYIGRYGGDEFLLICPGASQKIAIEVAERIRKTICNKKYLLWNDILINLTLSLGVYEFRKNDLSFIFGVKMADTYLYNAKNTSKNKVVCKCIANDK